MRKVSGGIGERIDSWLRPAICAERLASARILIGGFSLIYLLARFPHIWRVSNLPARQFRPIGLVSYIDSPLSSTTWHLLVVVTLILGLGFFLGFLYRIVAPLFALAFCFVLTYRSSWGMIFHTENLMLLHVAILSLFPAAVVWSLDWKRGGKKQVDEHWLFGWPIMLMSIGTVLAYFLAGYAKLRFGGFSWASGDVLRNYVAMDNMRKLLLGDTYSPLAGPAMQLGPVFAILASSSLLLELLAPLALFWRGFAKLWVPGVIAFHLGVVILMAIVFPYPISGVAFISFYRGERLLLWVKKKWDKRKIAKKEAE